MTIHDDRTPYMPGPENSPTAHTNIWPPPSPYPFTLPGPPAQPSPPKKRRLWLILAAGIGLFILIATIIGITLGSQSGTPRTSTPTGYNAEDQQRQLDETPAAEPTTEPPAPAATPKVGDIALRAKITSKECFGSAGCLITLKVQADYNGPALNPDDTWLVTYDINGVEDGPQVGSFEMTGDTYTVNEEDVSTKSSRSKVTVKVTDVEKVGI